MSYEATFFIVPARIMKLEGLTFSALKVYETIFQFWNKGKACYLSNAAIMERTGLKAESAIKSAFKYLEKHGELLRKTVNGKRYLAAPEMKIETDDSGDFVDKSASTETPPRLHRASPPASTEPHKYKKLNLKNNNKSFCKIKDQKKNIESDKIKSNKNTASSYVDRNTYTDEAKNAKRSSLDVAKSWLSDLPNHLRPKRYKENLKDYS